MSPDKFITADQALDFMKKDELRIIRKLNKGIIDSDCELEHYANHIAEIAKLWNVIGVEDDSYSFPINCLDFEKFKGLYMQGFMTMRRRRDNLEIKHGGPAICKSVKVYTMHDISTRVATVTYTFIVHGPAVDPFTAIVEGIAAGIEKKLIDTIVSACPKL